MIIGIDIDDTLTYLRDAKIETAMAYIKKNNLPYKLIKEDSHLFSEMFDWDMQQCDKFWFEEADNLLSNIEPLPNASEVITKLKKQGHKILIITARTKEWHADPYKLSNDWLLKHNIPFDELLVGHLDKTQICIDKKVELFIDDMPNTLRKLEAKKIKILLMKNPHNQTVTDLQVVNNWLEIETYLKNSL